MPALRTLALAMLAVFVVAIFALGYTYSQLLSESSKARDAALEVDAGVQKAITYATTQTVNIEIPAGYTLKFENYQIVIDGFTVPENGYSWPITGPELSGGAHTLSIKLENNSIVVSG